jgi:cytochrome c oxidase subunit IV
MEPIKKNVEGYKLYIITFTVLSILTLIAVGLTHVRFIPSFVVGLIMLIAAIQAVIVLLYNMHLKFHDKILLVFVGLVFSLILSLIIITMLDFIYR